MMRRYSFAIDWEFVFLRSIQMILVYALITLVLSIPLSTWLNIFYGYCIYAGLFFLLIALVALYRFAWIPAMRHLRKMLSPRKIPG